MPIFMQEEKRQATSQTRHKADLWELAYLRREKVGVGRHPLSMRCRTGAIYLCHIFGAMFSCFLGQFFCHKALNKLRICQFYHGKSALDITCFGYALRSQYNLRLIGARSCIADKIQ